MLGIGDRRCPADADDGFVPDIERSRALKAGVRAHCARHPQQPDRRRLSACLLGGFRQLCRATAHRLDPRRDLSRFLVEAAARRTTLLAVTGVAG